MAIDLVEGWTEPIEYTILADGAAVDLTGKTVNLLLYDCDQNLLEPAGELTITDAPTGKVAFTPAAGDLVAAKSPYYVRFHVVEDGFFAPNARAEEWHVRKP